MNDESCVSRSVTKKQIDRARGSNKKIWEIREGGFAHNAPILTFYNSGKNVFCFDYSFDTPSKEGKNYSCRVLIPGKSVSINGTGYAFLPEFVLYGHAFGKAVISVELGHLKEVFSIRPNERLHIVRWFSDEVADYNKFYLERYSVNNDFFHSIFGKDQCRKFEKLHCDISRDLLNILTITCKF